MAKKRDPMQIAFEAIFLLDPVCLGPEIIPDDVREFLLQAVKRRVSATAEDMDKFVEAWPEIEKILQAGDTKNSEPWKKYLGWSRARFYQVAAAVKLANRLPFTAGVVTLPRKPGKRTA